MQLFNFIVAIALLLLGLLITAYFGWLLIAPLFGLYQGGKGSGRHRKAAGRLKKVDALVAEHRCNEALKLLRRCTIFDLPKSDEGIQRIREHHQNFLSRCLLIAEEFGSRAENIAEVERLFIERAELQKLLLRADESFRSLKFRREQAGKHIPSWSKTDFEQRIKEIKSELKRNDMALANALKKLYDSLSRPAVENIVYH
ncbi:MAG: hypothetical protein KDD69_01375 [Bdellovibrionales bacterium]|nr:hypothetical protein [Bdellovibrionales bacterium]